MTPEEIALLTTNDDGDDAVALQAEGKTVLNGHVAIVKDVDDSAVEISNGSAGNNASALELTDGALFLSLDSPIEAGGAHNIVIGTRNTQQVHIGLAAHITQVTGQLDVKQATRLGPGAGPGEIDAFNNQNLDIGTNGSTTDVNIGNWIVGNPHAVNVAATLIVGPRGQGGIDNVDGDAHIDTNSTGGANDRNRLIIGHELSTADVFIGRYTRTVHLQEAAHVVGELTVGASGVAADGNIDARADAGSNILNIGTGGSTADVVLSRAGQTIDMFGQARMNSNAIIMNNADNITNAAALGVVENPIGHGFGPSLDFVRDGIVRFVVDSSGGHNV